jgi:DNA ligase-associated metallophosphoesterase
VTPAPIHLAGERLMLDPAGALYWPAARLLAVADLHLEKGSAFAPKGMLLPPWDSRATLDRLALLLRRWTPQIVIALGDSFHDAGGPARLPAAEAARLAAIAANHRLVWISGNHDPAPPVGLGDESCDLFADVFTDVFSLGPLRFRHAAVPGAAAGEISGHLHPKAAVRAPAGTVRRPCFVADARRVLLPAFGAYTGGLEVTDPAIACLFPRGGRVFLLGQERLFSFPLSGAPRHRA